MDVVAWTRVSPAGRVSVRTTPVAAPGPLFSAPTVNVTCCPSCGLALSTDLVTAMSAGCTGTTVAEAVLFSMTGSVSAAETTVAVSVTGEAVSTRTT